MAVPSHHHPPSGCIRRLAAALLTREERTGRAILAAFDHCAPFSPPFGHAMPCRRRRRGAGHDGRDGHAAVDGARGAYTPLACPSRTVCSPTPTPSLIHAVGSHLYVLAQVARHPPPHPSHRPPPPLSRAPLRQVARHEKYRRSADVYSFAMLLFELITHEAPPLPCADVARPLLG